jgi:hypothetical protein
MVVSLEERAPAKVGGRYICPLIAYSKDLVDEESFTHRQSDVLAQRTAPVQRRRLRLAGAELGAELLFQGGDDPGGKFGDLRFGQGGFAALEGDAH